MAGFGAGVEAAQELVVDGELDPWKIGMASVFQGLASNPNRVGKKILDSTAWHPLAKYTPKEEYVNEVTKKLGPKYKDAAEQLWERVAEQTRHPAGTLVPNATISDVVGQLADAQHALKGQESADLLDIGDYLKTMKPEEHAAADGENVYHSMPQEKAHSVNQPSATQRLGPNQPGLLTPEEAYAKQRFLDPVVAEHDKLVAQAKALGGEQFKATLGGHNTRMMESTWLKRLVKVGENLMGGGGFGREPDAVKSRKMFALEFPDGSQKVVHVDGSHVEGYGKAKQPFTLARFPKAVGVGDTVIIAGKKAKIVETTTDRIEAETEYIYSKHALSNNLYSNAAIKSYIREKQWLDKTIEGLEKMKYAVKKEEGVPAPKGYKTVKGDNRLEKYYIMDRIAETFEDGISKGATPSSAIQKLNQVAIGSMFWNPFPHLFNAADHWFNAVGWDFFKPWQYKSITKSLYDAYKDVSTISPAYRDYLRSGMGLNYGRVAAEGMYEKMLNGIDKPSMAAMAKSWGTHPGKFLSDIYRGAKVGLWAGSDMFMLSAYKHMASKQGVSIFNQALRNHVEAHNPNYRVPTRIGFDTMMKVPGMPEAVARSISRGLSTLMQSRAFNTFGRYHYGQFKSLLSDLHDVTLQNKESAQTRGEAASHMLFTAFTLGVVYPYVWDTLAKVVSGDDTAIKRRSGATTIPYTLYHMVLGDEQVGKLLSEAFNLPPITKGIVELASNRNLFTGQHIWEPGDNLLGETSDIGMYVAGSVAAPVKSAINATTDSKKEAMGQIGIQINTDVAEEKKAKREKREKTAAKRRQKTRGYFVDEENQ